MKRWWTVISARVDALSLRERVFLFASLLVVSMLLADVLWLSPAQSLHRQMTQRFAAQDAELQRLRDELRRSSVETGPGRQMRETLAKVRERLAAVNEEIAQTPTTTLEETPLSKVLVHFLRQQKGLVLVRTATLPVEKPSMQGTPLPGLKRRGLTLTVSGPYHELTRYVESLERALPALHWGEMKMASSKPPTELSLQVWLLEVTP
jgi:MSHA biogenesis protein MshJ